MGNMSKDYLKYFEENQAFMDEQIRLGIEINRKGNASLRFVDAQGAPVTDVHVEIHQEGHDFRFGANILCWTSWKPKKRTISIRSYLLSYLIRQPCLSSGRIWSRFRASPDTQKIPQSFTADPLRIYV